jgi:A/G-specific adenine glycosylase
VPIDRTALLDWYARHRRPLPWRTAPEAYGVWLSEVMSQQTRIDTVIPYWHRFRQRWPTLQDMAAAELDEVLGEWSGLGYYSRARRLHEAAGVMAAEGVPETVEGLRALPGVGPYTAAAIASIVFGVDAAVVDGNVERVICRVEDIATDPRGSATKRLVQATATAWLERGRAGDWNQALMELGATLCTPRRPRCGACPLAADCEALEAGTVLERPHKPRKQKQPQVREVALVLREEGRVLLARRAGQGLLGGLWEPPRAEGWGEEDAASLAAGLGAVLGPELGVVKHVFSHRRLSLQVWAGLPGGEPALPQDYDAMDWLEDLGELGVSTLARKVLAL